MSKVEKKAADATVTTGKAKDVIKDPEVAKAFGGKPDDKVVSIKLPGKAHEEFKESLAKAAQSPKSAGLLTLVEKHAPGALNYTMTPEIAEMIEAEMPPSDRQIRNAEKVLKAAGLDPEAKIGLAVAQALEKTQASGTFMVEGVLQEPIETGLTVQFNRIQSNVLQRDFYLPHPVNRMYADKVFSLYRQRTGEFEAYYLLDNNSTVTLSGGDARPGYYRPRNLSAGGVLILVNSSSNDDIVLGDSSLINTESAYNVLNNTMLARTKDPVNGPRFPFDHWEENLPVQKQEVKERLNIRETQFKHVSLIDSEVSRGVYRHSSFNNSIVRGSAHVTVERSNLYESEVLGTRITLEAAHLTKSYVSSESELLVKHVRFSGSHVRSKSIYIPNKFCYLELDTPQNKMFFVRSSRREFDLGNNMHSMERFKLDAPSEDIRRQVAIQLAMDPEGFHTRATLITRSVANYIADSILSRLRVIRLLDEAKQLVEEVGERRHDYDDIYSV
jgi:hypothetical protein